MNEKLIILRPDELAVIETMRKSGKYADFTIEKRPSNEFPDGELFRIKVETWQKVETLTRSMV